MGIESAKQPRNVIEAHSHSGRNGYSIPWTDEDCAPCNPTDATPGSDDKLRVLSDRAENGETLWSGDDGEPRFDSFKDMTAWVDADLERDRCRRVWRLVDPVLVEVDQIALYGRRIGDWGSYLFIDQVGMTGCAMSVHFRDRDEWASFDVVNDPMDSEPVQKLLQAVSGDRSKSAGLWEVSGE